MLGTIINAGVYLPKYTTGAFVLITNIYANVQGNEINMQLRNKTIEHKHRTIKIYSLS